MVTIPFDLETAKKIRKGERLGQIVAEKGRNRAEIVYEDDFCNAYPLLVVIHSIPVSTDWFSVTGESFSGANRLTISLPTSKLVSFYPNVNYLFKNVRIYLYK